MAVVASMTFVESVACVASVAVVNLVEPTSKKKASISGDLVEHRLRGSNSR